MKQKLITLAALFAASASAFAGGYVTNTNQNIAFLRQPAQNASISVNSVYYNPAGVAFLPDGWQLSFGAQTIHQRRHITSTFAPFALNTETPGQTSKVYKGVTDVPFLPTLDLTYVHGKFFGSMHFGVIGGGGACDFDNGLGSFEGNIAMIPALLNRLTGAQSFGYSVESNLSGTQYFAGAQLNLGYRVTDNLAVSLGLRGYYVYSHNEGGIRNIQLSYGGTSGPAAAVLGGALATMGMSVNQATLESLFADKELDCTQTDWTYTPIIGVDYKIGRFNLAARYEFNTRIRLNNDTKSNTTGLPQYNDGRDDIANDMPAILAGGVRYEATDALRLNLGFNTYFDKQAKTFNPATGANDKNDLVKGNSWEVLAGVEYDINDKFTVSLGGHNTQYNWGDGLDFISDTATYVPSYSVGGGFRFNLNPKMSFDFAAYWTGYTHRTKEMDDFNHVGATVYNQLASNDTLKALLQSAGITSADALAVPGSDKYFRQSIVLGIGLNYKF